MITSSKILFVSILLTACAGDQFNNKGEQDGEVADAGQSSELPSVEGGTDSKGTGGVHSQPQSSTGGHHNPSNQDGDGAVDHWTGPPDSSTKDGGEDGGNVDSGYVQTPPDSGTITPEPSPEASAPEAAPPKCTSADSYCSGGIVSYLCINGEWTSRSCVGGYCDETTKKCKF